MRIPGDAGKDPRRLDSREREYLHGLYTAHSPALRFYLRRLGYRGDAAEDWVQETFLIAIRRIDVLRASADPGAYLLGILRNVIGYHLRSMKYAEGIVERLRAGSGEDEEGRRDELEPETLYRGLVSDEELKLLLAFYLLGRSQKELAEELGIELNACKKRIQRAKEHLRAALERDGLV